MLFIHFIWAYLLLPSRALIGAEQALTPGQRNTLKLSKLVKWSQWTLFRFINIFSRSSIKVLGHISPSPFGFPGDRGLSSVPAVYLRPLGYSSF